MRKMQPAVYIMASGRNGTLYTGVTSDLVERVYEHRIRKRKKSFASRYDCVFLVYYELCRSMVSAIEYEKALKSRTRQRKIELIEGMNPDWRDLFHDINRF